VIGRYEPGGRSNGLDDRIQIAQVATVAFFLAGLERERLPHLHEASRWYGVAPCNILDAILFALASIGGSAGPRG